MAAALVHLLCAIARNRGGNIAIIAAASLPILVGSLALGIDWGYLGYQKRDAQAATDLAALSAASSLAAPGAALSAYLTANHLTAALSGETNSTPADAPTAAGVMTYARGHYTASAAIPPSDRFVAGQAPFNAVRVRLKRRAELTFSSLFAKPPIISTEAIAENGGIAAFSIGSRLASLNGGILNAVLGKLLGTQLNLTAMDYRSLLDTDVDVLSFLDTVSTRLDLDAASYSQVLDTRLSIGRFAGLLSETPALTGAARDALERIAAATASQDGTIDLAALFDLGKLASQKPGAMVGLPVKANLLSILSAAGAVAGGNRQIDLDLGTNLPGLAELSVSLLVGEPPKGSAWFAVGGAGTLVRTAQTKLKIDAAIGGSGLLSAVHIDLPIYLELAYAEGRITDISCLGSSPDNAEVDVAARPGIAEAWIGAIPGGKLSDLPTDGTAGMNPARLVDTRLLGISIDGFAHARIADPGMQALRFSPNDISYGRVQSVSTHSYAGSLLASLIGDLRLDVHALGLGLVTPTLVQKALAASLSAAVKPLDDALANVLATLGIRVGEADIRVTGVSCGHPVLVQ